MVVTYSHTLPCHAGRQLVRCISVAPVDKTAGDMSSYVIADMGDTASDDRQDNTAKMAVERIAIVCRGGTAGAAN